MNGVLSKKSERIVVDCLFAYIIETFSDEPPQHEIIECCKAAVQLFPCFETSPSEMGGIVSRKCV